MSGILGRMHITAALLKIICKQLGIMKDTVAKLRLFSNEVFSQVNASSSINLSIHRVGTPNHLLNLSETKYSFHRSLAINRHSKNVLRS